METVRIRVRWADMDSYGHVNNAIYLNYIEEARDRVMERLFDKEGYDFVLAHVDINFRSEVTQDDGEVTVQCRVASYGRSSVRTREVVLKPDGALAAEAEAVSVPRDAVTGGSRPLTESEISRLTAEIDADTESGFAF